MEQYNFFKGIHPEIDEEILKIQSRQKEKKSSKKQQKTIWNPSFFDSSSQEESKTYRSTKKKEETNITHLKKDELSQIMKNVMLQFLESKRMSINKLENLIKNMDTKKITKKSMKDKIILFSKLLSIPIVFQEKKIRFDVPSQISVTPHYNRKENLFLKKIYEMNNVIHFRLENISNLQEAQYFLYCLLKSIKIYYPNLIPQQYKCLTFLNIYQLVHPTNYKDVVHFLKETFPTIFFIIQELGLKNKKEKFNRYLFINEPETTQKKNDNYILKELHNHEIPKIFLRRIINVNSLSVIYELMTSLEKNTTFEIFENEEFCI
jgi:arsenate reductase-like glutaredoxin family protein